MTNPSGQAGCRCLASTPRSLHRSSTSRTERPSCVDGVNVTFPASYGLGCSAHDGAAAVVRRQLASASFLVRRFLVHRGCVRRGVVRGGIPARHRLQLRHVPARLSAASRSRRGVHQHVHRSLVLLLLVRRHDVSRWRPRVRFGHLRTGHGLLPLRSSDDDLVATASASVLATAQRVAPASVLATAERVAPAPAFGAAQRVAPTSLLATAQRVAPTSVFAATICVSTSSTSSSPPPSSSAPPLLRGLRAPLGRRDLLLDSGRGRRPADCGGGRFSHSKAMASISSTFV